MRRDEHYLDNLVDYVKKNLRKGYDKDSLRWALINQKNPKMEVDKAIKMAEEQLAKEAARNRPAPAPPKVEIVEPKIERKSFFSKFFGK